MTERRDHLPDESRRRRFEVRDVPALGLVLFGAGLAVVVLGAMSAMWWLYSGQMGVAPTATDSLAHGWSYTEGHLVEVLEEKAQMQEDVEARIGRYEWIDREAGIARIPIERAMTIVAMDGLPDWNPDAKPKPPVEMIYEKAAEQR